MSNILLKISNFILHILKLVSAVAIAVGLFLGGVAWQQSSSERELEKLELQGYIKGQTEAKTLYDSQDSQTLLIGKIMAVLLSPEVTRVIPDTTASSIRKASDAIAVGDYNSANILFPNGVQFSTDKTCVSFGSTLLVSKDDIIKVCNEDITIIVTGIFENNFQKTINGESYLLSHGYRNDLGNGCYLSYDRYVSPKDSDDWGQAWATLGCSGVSDP